MNQFKQIPNRAIIIGGGASIREQMWSLSINKLPIWKNIKDEFTIGTNFSFEFFNSTVLMYSDYHFYGANQKKLKNIPLILGKDDGAYHRKNGIKIDNNVMFLKECETKKYKKWGANKAGLHPFYWGKEAWTRGFFSSQLIGIKALNLAIALNCKDIYLLGFDATDINGHTHFYDNTDIGKYTWETNKYNGTGKNERGKYRTGNYNKIEELNKFWFQPFEQELKNGIKIYNVSLQSKIDTFPKISYKEFYNKLQYNKIKVNHEEIRNKIRKRLKQ